MQLPSFDTMKSMSPEELSALHSKAFEDAIKHLPVDIQQRERARQWRRTQELNKIKNPYVRAMKANEQMMENVKELQRLWTELAEAVAGLKNIK